MPPIFPFIQILATLDVLKKFKLSYTDITHLQHMKLL